MHKIFSIICHYSLENENFPLCIAMEISLSDAFECEKDRQFNCYKWPPEVAGMFKWKTEKLEKKPPKLRKCKAVVWWAFSEIWFSHD